MVLGISYRTTYSTINCSQNRLLGFLHHGSDKAVLAHYVHLHTPRKDRHGCWKPFPWASVECTPCMVNASSLCSRMMPLTGLEARLGDGVQITTQLRHPRGAKRCPCLHAISTAARWRPKGKLQAISLSPWAIVMNQRGSCGQCVGQPKIGACANLAPASSHGVRVGALTMDLRSRLRAPCVCIHLRSSEPTCTSQSHVPSVSFRWQCCSK